MCKVKDVAIASTQLFQVYTKITSLVNNKEYSTAIFQNKCFLLLILIDCIHIDLFQGPESPSQ